MIVHCNHLKKYRYYVDPHSYKRQWEFIQIIENYHSQMTVNTMV